MRVEKYNSESINTFFEKNRNATLYDFRQKIGVFKFRKWLKDNSDLEWAALLSFFTSQTNLQYWDDVKIDLTIGLLEKDVDLSIKKIVSHKDDLDKAFGFLFRKKTIAQNEGFLGFSKLSDLEQITNEFNPEYLRISEHIFNNFLCVLWSVVVCKKSDAKFDLAKMVSDFGERQLDIIFEGCDNRIRNSLAHGLMNFEGLEINFYTDREGDYRLDIDEYLNKFDLLWRSTVSLAVSIVLFLARNLPYIEIKKFDLPPNLLKMFCMALYNRKGFNFSDILIRISDKNERQLHILVNTTYLSRNVILNECIKISVGLLKNGFVDFSRYLFEVDCGKKITGLLIIDIKALFKLINNDTSISELANIKIDNLLWFDESPFIEKCKMFFDITNSQIAPAIFKFYLDLYCKNVVLPKFMYSIKSIDKSSAGGLCRIEIDLMFNFPQLFLTENNVRLILHAVTKKYKNKLIQFERFHNSNERRNFGYPSYVWINIYKNQGSIRWLKNYLINQSNLLAKSEMIIKRNAKPQRIFNPNLIYKGINIEINQELIRN